MIRFKTVKILGQIFRVLTKPQQEVAKLTPESPYTIGLMDGLDDQIHVSNDVMLKAQRRTFAHEWSHAISEVNGLNQSLDPVIAEIVAQSTANALLELLEQKEVMKFLMSETTKRKKKKVKGG